MTDLKMLESKVRQIRLLTTKCIGSFGMGHIGGALSISDLLAVLYFERMRVDPKDPKKPDRDRLVLSKGHAGPGLYAALSLKGYFPEEMLYTLNKPDTLLPSHCDMQRTPGVDMTAGSLGQGLSCAVGMALGANLKGLDSHIYAILSEGCCQEGSTWEAAMYAGSKKVSNLTVFVDRNGLQIDGNVDEINSLQNLAAKWNAFGWKAINVADGHDIEQIIDALDNRDIRGPTAIILKTVKGKGISFLEGQVLSHHAILDESQWRAAIEELEGGGLNA